MTQSIFTMKKTTLLLLMLSMLGFSKASLALSDLEVEDLADLTAVFIYLKNDCGYNYLRNTQIKRAIVYFAEQNRWDLSNYNNYNMNLLGENSYRDLTGIAISTHNKCKLLARDSLSLLAYAN